MFQLMLYVAEVLLLLFVANLGDMDPH